MKNSNLPEHILKTIESLTEANCTYQDAMDVIMQNKDFYSTLSNTFVSNFDVIEDALERGLCAEKLSKSLSELLEPYHIISSTQTTIKALGSSFEGMLKPEAYTSVHKKAMEMTKLVQSEVDFQTLKVSLDSILQTSEVVDTTWLKNSSAWLVEKSVLSKLDVGILSGLSSQFSRLCTLEHDTSLLDIIPESFTSVASQVASIMVALEKIPIKWRYNDLVSNATLINDYFSLATQQHELLKKATKPEEVSWRLGILDAASRLVDRQFDWYLGFADAIANEEIKESSNYTLAAEPTALYLLPFHFGYTRRIKKTPTEGLERSSIVSITEKGKRIGDSVVVINQLRLDNGDERMFVLSESVVGGLLNLSNVVCTNKDQLGRIIDALYFVFYENLKHIKMFIGEGDENRGDQMVRKKDIYQCIFDVKEIRNDLRHDLCHGSPEKVRTKLKSIGDCYKKYCGNRPLRPKDYKKLQENIYDKVLELEDTLIQMML